MVDMLKLDFTEAKKEKIWVKIALMAPSGGGKTFSALRLAEGMQKRMIDEGGKPEETGILMLNTEAHRGRYYADLFKFDIMDVPSPHHPNVYINLIDQIVKHGKHKVLIIDSTTHEWSGSGGCLEIHAALGGRYQDWGSVTPLHVRFLEAIADSPLHIIATMRGKDQYVMEVDDTGSTTIKKMGVGSQQRSGFEYEFTTTFTIDQKTHYSTPQKDNTHLFPNTFNEHLNPLHGESIIDWANSGKGSSTVVRHIKPIAMLQTEVTERVRVLGGSRHSEALKMLTDAGGPNPTDIGNRETLEKLLSDLSVLEPVS